MRNIEMEWTIHQVTRALEVAGRGKVSRKFTCADDLRNRLVPLKDLSENFVLLPAAASSGDLSEYILKQTGLGQLTCIPSASTGALNLLFEFEKQRDPKVSKISLEVIDNTQSTSVISMQRFDTGVYQTGLHPDDPLNEKIMSPSSKVSVRWD